MDRGSMRAMVLRAPGDLALEEVERPRAGQDHVVVRVTHSAICGTDLKIYRGAIPVRHPLIMGHEMIGDVVGGSDEGPPGRRVIVDPVLFCGVCFHCRAGQTNLCPDGVLLGRDADGGFADYVVAPRSHVHSLPVEIDSETAPLIQVLTTCVHAQRLVEVFPGESVAVVGLGVAGQLHVQLSKARGGHPVVGITRSTLKRELAMRLGADAALAAGDEVVRGVLDATGGRGADVVIESTGVAARIADAIAMVRAGGRLLLFGITTASDSGLPFYQLYFKELTIRNARAARSEDYHASIDLVRRNVVRLRPLVSDVVPLPKLGAALATLASERHQQLKIVLQNV